MEIKPTYVTFEQAKLIKEKDFDFWVSKHYCFEEPEKLRCSNGFKMPRCSPQTPPFNYMKLDGVYYAPEQWQVIEWLRLKHGIWISTDFDGKVWFEVITILPDKNRLVQNGHNSPQEAYSAAFDYVLKELI